MISESLALCICFRSLGAKYLICVVKSERYLKDYASKSNVCFNATTFCKTCSHFSIILEKFIVPKRFSNYFGYWRPFLR